MRRGAIFAGADVSDGLAIGGNTNMTKWPARRGESYHLAIRHVNPKDAVGILIGLGMIGGGNDEILAAGHPGQLFDLPVGWGYRLRIARFDRQQPNARLFVVFV